MTKSSQQTSGKSSQRGKSSSIARSAESRRLAGLSKLPTSQRRQEAVTGLLKRATGAN